jgi:hypothetical protein
VAETGLVGLAGLAVLVAGAVIAIRRHLAAGDRITTAAAAGALVALLGAGLTGFPLEMPATIALAGLALGLVGRRLEASTLPATAIRAVDSETAAAPLVRLGPPRRMLGRLAVLAAGAVLLWSGWRAQKYMRGSAWLGAAERAPHRDPGPMGTVRALGALDRAAALTPGAFRVHLRTAQVMLGLHQSAEAARAAWRALYIEPFSPNAWTILASAQLEGGKVGEARLSAGRALALLADDPFALSVDARAAEASGDAEGASLRWRRLEALTGDAADPTMADAARALLRAYGKAKP